MRYLILEEIKPTEGQIKTELERLGFTTLESTPPDLAFLALQNAKAGVVDSLMSPNESAILELPEGRSLVLMKDESGRLTASLESYMRAFRNEISEGFISVEEVEQISAAVMRDATERLPKGEKFAHPLAATVRGEGGEKANTWALASFLIQSLQEDDLGAGWGELLNIVKKNIPLSPTETEYLISGTAARYLKHTLQLCCHLEDAIRNHLNLSDEWISYEDFMRLG